MLVVLCQMIQQLVVMKYNSGICDPLTKTRNNFDDPLTYHLAPLSGQHFKLFSTSVYDQKLTG